MSLVPKYKIGDRVYISSDKIKTLKFGIAEYLKNLLDQPVEIIAVDANNTSYTHLTNQVYYRLDLKSIGHYANELIREDVLECKYIQNSKLMKWLKNV